MTRTGKIARLPRQIREIVNKALRDGAPGQALVKWLNSLPEAQSVLAAEFDERPINEQNLSDWKKGGYEDWLRHQERRAFVRSLAEEAGDLEEAAGKTTISHRLSSILAAELASLLSLMLEESKGTSERFERMKEVIRELSQLRKEDHQAGRLGLELERWEIERNRLFEEDTDRLKKKEKDKVRSPIAFLFHRDAIAKAFGGGTFGDEIAAMLFEVEYDLPMGTFSRKAPDSKNGAEPDKTQKPNAPESTPINPNQGESR
jgi:hypothetical protein